VCWGNQLDSIWQIYKQERGYVLACNFAKYSPILIFFTDILINKPFLIWKFWLLTTPPHVKYVATLPCKKGKGSPCSITDSRVPEQIPVGSQPAGDVSHKPGGRQPLLSARSAVTPATLKRAATSFVAW